MKKQILVVVLFFMTLLLPAQTHKKGQFFAFWGWNISNYTKSDIHFTKAGEYDFRLSDVPATDKKSKVSWDFINPGRVTIPQTSYKIGYFVSDHYAITLGVDHMKYVMVQDVDVNIDGYISKSGTKYDGEYHNQKINLTEDFLTFEHTDGLNYIHLGADRVDDVSSLFGIRTENFRINTILGAEMGVVMPKTNAKLLGNERSDRFHVAGYGSNVAAGLDLTFFKHYFITANIKGGYIYLPDIKTTLYAADKASQHFYFLEENIAFGVKFGL